MRSFASRVFVSVLAISSPAAGQASALGVTMQRVNDEVVLEVGPVDLPMTGERTVGGMLPVKIVIPVDGWFRGYRIETIDAHGETVPGGLVVVNVLSLAERELFSPIALRIASIAPGTPSVPLPRFLGYRAIRGDTLLVSAQFHRASGRVWEGVRARIVFPFVPKSAFVGALRIQPFSFEIMPPGGSHVYDLPVGRSEQSWEGRPAVDGNVLGFGGQLKKYALFLRLEDRTDHRTLWEHRADTTESGDLKPVPVARFIGRLGLRLHANHVYRLTAAYDNRSGASVPGGGAGVLGGVFLVGSGEHWPRIDPADTTYQRDLRGFLP
jgi:hypothetical protein